MIKVLIVDDIAETRDHLTKLLSFEHDIEVGGTAASGEEGIRQALDLRPDVILMDINMPEMDGIAAAEMIGERLPSSPIIMMSVQGEPDYLKRAMLAGAREFLVKPFSADELATSIRQVHQREAARRAQTPMVPTPAAPVGAGPDEPAEHTLVGVFAPKGGSGRTTVATNLAVAIHRETGASVCLFDANFQFGDVGVLLNLNPKNRSIADAVESGDPDPDIIESVLINHSTGIRVLLAPPTPETSELVTTAHVKKVLEYLTATHAYVIVDLPSTLNDQSLAIMDAADTLLVLSALEITNIKNVRLFLEVADQLDYDRSKVRLVINRSDATQGIRLNDVEASIRRQIEGTIVSDGRLTVLAVNRGVPFVVSHPDAAVSRDIVKLARAVARPDAAVAPKPIKRGLFARR